MPSSLTWKDWLFVGLLAALAGLCLALAARAAPAPRPKPFTAKRLANTRWKVTVHPDGVATTREDVAVLFLHTDGRYVVLRDRAYALGARHRERDRGAWGLAPDGWLCLKSSRYSLVGEDGVSRPRVWKYWLGPEKGWRTRLESARVWDDEDGPPAERVLLELAGPARVANEE